MNLNDWWNSISTSKFSEGKIANLLPQAIILISLTSNYLSLVAEDCSKHTKKVIFIGPKTKLPDLDKLKRPILMPLMG